MNPDRGRLYPVAVLLEPVWFSKRTKTPMAVLLSPAELNSRLNVPVAVLLVPVVSLAIPTIDRRNCLSRCHTRTVASGGIERAYGAVLNRAGPDAGIVIAYTVVSECS